MYINSNIDWVLKKLAIRLKQCKFDEVTTSRLQHPFESKIKSKIRPLSTAPSSGKTISRFWPVGGRVLCDTTDLRRLCQQTSNVHICPLGGRTVHRYTPCLTVGVCYRSQSDSEKELEELFRSTEITSNWQALLMGDFNYRKINWDTWECDSTGSKFRDLLLDNLYQHVEESTRESNRIDKFFHGRGFLKAFN